MMDQRVRNILNRNRTIGLYCHLIGTYTEWTHASALELVGNGEERRTRRVYPDEYKDFMDRYEPALLRFCGSYYAECKSPDVLPHPIRIAIEIKNGRTEGVRWGMEYLERNGMLPKGTTANAMISKVISLMHDHGMYKETDAHNG